MTVKFKKIKQDPFPFSKFGFKKLQNLVENISLDIVLEAKAHHKFEPRSGDLERSVMNHIKISKNKIISVFKLEDRIADYGKWIHGGFHSWKADKFLEKPFEKKTKQLKKLIKQKMNRMK